jgi:exportin-2 (importin alpha re-exporter)
LGVFQKLIASKANDSYGFALISGIVQHLPPVTYQSYLPTVWQLLFTRLQVRGSRAQFIECLQDFQRE